MLCPGKKREKKPIEIARRLAVDLKPSGLVREIKDLGPYVNFYLDWDKFGRLCLNEILKKKERYGSAKGRKERVLVEHTSANPDGPLHLGHLRNSVIGDSIARILKFTGNDVRTIFWANDTGRQIAIAVMEFRKSFRSRPKKLPEKGDWWVLDLYLKGNKRIEKNKSMDSEITSIINDFESGNRALAGDFRFITDMCIRGQKETLSRAGIKIDEYFRESKSLFDGSVAKILEQVKRLPQGKTDSGRLFVDLKKFGIEREFTLTREDGTTIYPARDLAFHSYKFSRAGKNINIIGTDQKFYFRQLISTLGLLFPEKTKNYRVVFYEFLILPMGTMSTRAGKFISVDELLENTRKAAIKTVKEKMPDYAKKLKEKIAEQVSVGALKYAMIKVSPEKTYSFSIKDMLKFDGDTAPYIQYTHARACSILRKGKVRKAPKFDSFALGKEIEKELIKKLAEFPDTVSRAARDLRPHYIANYAYRLADLFNNFYQKVPVLNAEKEEREARIALVIASKTVLKNALNLLGIEAPERM